MAKLKTKSKNSVLIDSEVVRKIHQHARSHMKTEVCGVLIGERDTDVICVEACIPGLNASQAGTHVTFTQDTWEHVYKIKDKEYPDARIVGWYHSHPGFGVFLSDHDTFIHKNFFSSPDQIAWVYDPHSDEEGCFVWVDERIERIASIRLNDPRGGEVVDPHPRPEPAIDIADDEVVEFEKPKGSGEPVPVWARLLATGLSYLTAVCLGVFICWYFFPRPVFVAVPVDPFTGQPIQELMRQPDTQKMSPSSQPGTMTPNTRSGPPATGSANPGKGNDGHPKQ